MFNHTHMLIQKKWILFLIVIGAFITVFAFFSSVPGVAYVVSISSDGHYAVTSDENKDIVLWNVQNKSAKIISHNANIYSAYFIKNTPYFMWQDLNNVVHVQSVVGTELMNFKNFPTYGQVMTSDLKHYIASDQAWNLYSGIGKNQRMIKSSYDTNGFLGTGKLLNLTLSSDNHILLTSGDTGGTYDRVPLSAGYSAKEAAHKGYDVGVVNASLLGGVVTWDLATEQPLCKFPGNEGKTFATFSPDGDNIVSFDEVSNGFVWQTNGKKMFEIDDIFHGRPVDPDNFHGEWDKSGLIKIPNDFHQEDGVVRSWIISTKFIDANHYLRFTTYTPYAILYHSTEPQPLKYIPLVKDPFPSVSDYSRDESIDTAPAVNILVTGQDTGNGIVVYKYDPKTQTLNPIWITKIGYFGELINKKPL